MTMAKNHDIFPALSIRSSIGVEIWNSTGSNEPYAQDGKFSRDESKFCRTSQFSPDGRYFVWANGSVLQICTTNDWKIVANLPRPKAFAVKFSPKGTYLMSMEVYFVNQLNAEGSPNLFVYKVATGEEVYSTVLKKQTDWEPCWTNDESVMGIMIGGEVLFFDAAADFKVPVMKMGGGRNGKFSMSPSNKKFLAFYVPGVKGAPSMCKLYQYPNVNGQPIGCKSFFQADQVEMLWNKKGTDLLLLTSTEIDQTGASYYGKQALHFMSTNGDSYSVQLSKEGPIHAVEWSPKSNEFCVVYGYMPANATIFNVKCDAVHNFESGPRNAVYYNSFGNILLLAGFGNLRGLIEVWDMTKRKQITTIQAPDSTQLEWHPSGSRFATATTAPRLRMSNGFKVWHYSGALLHETIWPTPAELYEIKWQRCADGVYPEPAITSEKVEGIKSSVPEASAQVYRPPNVRLGLTADDTPKIPGLYPASTKSTDKKSGNKRRDYWNKKKKSENSNAEESSSGAATEERDKKPQSAPAGGSGGGGGGGGGGSSGTGNNGNNSFKSNTTNTNNGYNKQNTRRPNSTRERDNRDPNRPFSRGPSDNDANASPKLNNNDRDGGDRSEQSSQRQSAENRSGRRASRTIGGNYVKPTGDPEKDKRIKTIQKKLQDISKLKGRQNHGEQLEVNQLTKISTEPTLMAELKQLSLQ